MNRTLKRVLGLTGSVMLGVAGAVTFASAAQAHHPEIKGVTDCADDGGWTVTWQVTDWDDSDVTAGKITGISTQLDEGATIAVGADLPGLSSGDHLTGTQTFAADVPSAEITIDAKWEYDGKVFTNSKQGKVDAPTEDCTPPENSPSPSPEEPEEPQSEVEAYGWVDCLGIYVEATNWNEEALADITFAPSNGDEVTHTPGVEEWVSGYFPLDDPETGLTVDILVDGELYDTYTWAENSLCGYATVEVDCADGLVYTLAVPAEGEETTFYFYADHTGEEITETVAPGETKTVTIAPVDDTEFWVEYHIEIAKDDVWGRNPWIPCDEETPAPSETPSAQPQLPTTGSSLTIMIGSAAALILAAGVIFMIMRRRRAAQDW